MGGYIKARSSSSILDDDEYRYHHNQGGNNTTDMMIMNESNEIDDENDCILVGGDHHYPSYHHVHHHLGCSLDEDDEVAPHQDDTKAHFNYPVHVVVGQVMSPRTTTTTSPVGALLLPGRAVKLGYNHKSLSDYCVTSSRYILGRYRRRYRAYRQHFKCGVVAGGCCGVGSKLSKSMSVYRQR